MSMHTHMHSSKLHAVFHGNITKNVTHRVLARLSAFRKRSEYHRVGSWHAHARITRSDLPARYVRLGAIYTREAVHARHSHRGGSGDRAVRTGQRSPAPLFTGHRPPRRLLPTARGTEPGSAERTQLSLLHADRVDNGHRTIAIALTD